jgi:hypothetical protein
VTISSTLRCNFCISFRQGIRCFDIWYFKWQFSYLTQNISKHWFELQTSHMRCQFWHISKKSIEDVAKFSKNFISLHALKITDSETTQICELTLYFHYDAFKILNQLK